MFYSLFNRHQLLFILSFIAMKKTIIFFAILCSACTFQTKHRGFVFPDDLKSEISKSKTTDDLEKSIGSPQTKTILGDPVWIYYGLDENYHGPFPVTYDNKTALLVWSSKDGKITKTKILKDKDLPDIQLDSDETKIPAAVELNAVEELINNIGRFTPSGLAQ
jgi:hypothetical protein